MPSKAKVKARRLELGLSLEQAADLIAPFWATIGVMNASVLSKIERGARNIYADEIPLIAQAYGCEPNDLHDWPPSADTE